MIPLKVTKNDQGDVVVTIQLKTLMYFSLSLFRSKKAMPSTVDQITTNLHQIAVKMS